MSTVTDIGAGAFAGSGLTSLVVPYSVITIGVDAFSGCTSLASILLERYPTSSNPTSGYTNLGTNCFSGTTAINATNYSSITTNVINGYTESSFLASGMDSAAVTNAIAASCFNEDTKILCFNPDSNEEEYVLVQNLKKGDLVKSYLHGYRKIDVMCKGKLRNNTKYFTNCMYRMRKTETNELIEDLIVIGGHSLLVDKLSEEEYLRTCSIWGTPLRIDEKYLLLAGITDKFEIIEGTDLYTYYHFCLENDGNDEARYGVWANGALVETPCKKDILGFLNVLYFWLIIILFISNIMIILTISAANIITGANAFNGCSGLSTINFS
jgi:hypothetical protein